MLAFIRLLASGLLFVTIFSPFSAYADLSSAQMDAAKLQALSGKILNLPTSCPSVTVPSALITNQEDFDSLENQLKRAQLCTIAIRESTKRPNVVERVQSLYPKAAPSQIEEITHVVLISARPIIEEHEAILDKTETAASHAALPMLRRKEIESLIEEKFKLCEEKEPKEQEWKSWVAAEMFLAQYALFEKCVTQLFHAVEKMNATQMVNTHYFNDPVAVQHYLLRAIPNSQETGLNELASRLDAIAPIRARAKSFAMHDRETDAKTYPK